MTHDIDALVAAALVQYEALTPEQKAAHDEAQRQSWVHGQTELDRLDREDALKAQRQSQSRQIGKAAEMGLGYQGERCSTRS
jgi:hypothetical protein